MGKLEGSTCNRKVRTWLVSCSRLLTFGGSSDAKRAYLRRKYTATKKAHYTEGWVEFKDKRVARSIAEMLNAQPIGGKKGTRWRDDVWTMKYLPRFKWNMLTEQIGSYCLSQCIAYLMCNASSP